MKSRWFGFRRNENKEQEIVKQLLKSHALDKLLENYFRKQMEDFEPDLSDYSEINTGYDVIKNELTHNLDNLISYILSNFLELDGLGNKGQKFIAQEVLNLLLMKSSSLIIKIEDRMQKIFELVDRINQKENEHENEIKLFGKSKISEDQIENLNSLLENLYDLDIGDDEINKELDRLKQPSLLSNDRRCCQLTGRSSEIYCNICGKIVPDKWVSQKD